MEASRNPNHPAKGSSILVHPIKSRHAIGLIKEKLAGNPRDYALFIVGINTNLRASDLVRITAGQVRNLSPMDEIYLNEQKTGKPRRISLNKACVDAINALLASRAYKDDESIFSGQRGPLTVPSINKMVKAWCRSVNLDGNYGAHTLRKTWCYCQYFYFKVPIAVLMEMLNHSSQRQTLSYICVQPEHIAQAYMNEI